MLAIAVAIYSSLLIVTGIAKMRRPAETSRALAAFGFPDHSAIGWSIGATETALGVTTLITANRWAFLAQGLLYLAFAGWVMLAMRSELPLSSCGCLGRDDTPPYWGHLLLDVGGALASTLAAASASVALLSGGLLSAVVIVVLIGVGVFLAWMILDAGARLHGARNP